MPPFDHFIIIDWSARKAPSPARSTKDAIWMAEGKAATQSATGRGPLVRTAYCRTRHAAILQLRKSLLRLQQEQQRVFVGFDFSFGYPQGFAEALQLDATPVWLVIWAELYQQVEDAPNNENNRFLVAADFNRRMKAKRGPFWGVTQGQDSIHLGARKDFDFPVKTGQQGRLAEKRLVETRHTGLQSSWKLAYTGSVGSQTLLGIPYLYQLRYLDEKLQEHIRIWPFETGLQYPAQGQIIFGEIWPSLIPRPRQDDIPDREQVRTYLQWLREEQKAGSLNRQFAGPVALSLQDRKRVIDHEGWVLGVL